MLEWHEQIKYLPISIRIAKDMEVKPIFYRLAEHIIESDGESVYSVQHQRWYKHKSTQTHTHYECRPICKLMFAESMLHSIQLTGIVSLYASTNTFRAIGSRKIDWIGINRQTWTNQLHNDDSISIRNWVPFDLVATSLAGPFWFHLFVTPPSAMSVYKIKSNW